MASSIKLDDPLIKEFVVKNAGDDAFSIIKSLNRGKTDEQISRKTKLKVNTKSKKQKRKKYLILGNGHINLH